MSSRAALVGVAVSSLVLCAAVGAAADDQSDYTCTFNKSMVADVNACSMACSCAAPNATDTTPKDKSENRGIAYALVIAAGLSTTIGAAAVFWKSCVVLTNTRVLSLSLGFSAGVMMYVSFVEIFVKSVEHFENCDCLWNSKSAAYVMGSILFFCGVAITYSLDAVVHALLGSKHSHTIDMDEYSASDTATDENGVEMTVRDPEAICDAPAAKEATEDASGQNSADNASKVKSANLERMGILTAIAIGLHNLPEGLATFVAAMDDPAVGGALAIAIAIHNIPEGVCVSVPMYYATHNRTKAFLIAFYSGVAEIVGAALGDLFLSSIFGDVAYGIIFGIVGGMMVAISLKELIPTAFTYLPGKDAHHISNSIFIGMLVMALSLVLFEL